MLGLGTSKAQGKDSNKNIAVSINKELEVFIDKEPVSEIDSEQNYPFIRRQGKISF
jgi:biopolymer transport protein ExbD